MLARMDGAEVPHPVEYRGFGAIASRSVGVVAMVFPSQYMSSASLETTPSSRRSPSTQHNSSSSAVSDPDIPIAERAYTHTPRNGVTTPQYFIDSCDRGIW